MKRRLSRPQVLKKVCDAIKRHAPHDFSLHILERGVRRLEDSSLERTVLWWHVPVYPDPAPKDPYQYYDALAEIEGDLQDEQGLDIALLPASVQQAEGAKEQNHSRERKPKFKTGNRC